ncbi:hypothetical protein C1T17_16995 [Sphingobium sp. SCG-1]|nr:hypothetical protein C1T17_16995 [Sphingobium sp. SCG-1]
MVGAGILLTGWATSGLHATAQTQPRAEVFTKVLDCRGLSDSIARLECYDQQVSAMATAAQRDEVVVLDKEELKKTRRSLFGFSLPRLPFLNDGGDNRGPQAAEFAKIETTIKSATNLGYGKWQFMLEDGAQWQTTEPIANRLPKAGLPIVIKRASLGSFMGSVNGWTSVRMKRVG